jgi:hypothetical protein
MQYHRVMYDELDRRGMLGAYCGYIRELRTDPRHRRIKAWCALTQSRCPIKYMDELLRKIPCEEYRRQEAKWIAELASSVKRT